MLLLPCYAWQFQVMANSQNLNVQTFFYNTICHHIQCFHYITYFKQRYWLFKNRNLGGGGVIVVVDKQFNENATEMPFLL